VPGMEAPFRLIYTFLAISWFGNSTKPYPTGFFYALSLINLTEVILAI
jgi:hypothetical protein